MRQLRPLIPPVALALCAFVPVVASASYPVGVWGVVEKVTPGPDMMKPNQVRIEGVFMVANQLPDFPMYPGYGQPTWGYMFYECPADQLATCAMEWADLTAASLSENKCRGWGDQSFKTNGTVRPYSEPQANPDLWPISMGVVEGFSPCEALNAWIQDNPPPPMGDTTGTGGDTSSSSGTGDTGGTTGGDTGGTTGTSGDTRGTTGAPDTTGTTTTTTGGDTTATGGGDTGGKTGGDVATGGGGDTGGSGGDSGGETGDGQDSGDVKDEGCGCRAEGPGGDAFGALVFGLGLGALRRRRR